MLGKKLVKLLIVHEHETVRSLLHEYAELAKHDHDVICEDASSIEEVNAKICEWVPSVVLVDVHNTAVDCLSVLERWKHGISSIVVTGGSRSQALEQSLRARGATAYIPATEAPEDVDSLLKNIIEMAPEAHYSQ